MKKKISLTAALLSFCLILFAGCSEKAPAYEQFSPYISEVDDITLPDGGIIALGEATHGNKEFNELKLEVFRQMVIQQNARVFAIEGDFGGCQKANDYIQSGEGTAAQAVSEIGFAIYETQEMANLLEWMREFNTERGLDDQIRFYGYDMQRYDNNKEKLNQILKPSMPELAEKYEKLLTDITDETMYDLNDEVLESLTDNLDILYAELKENKEEIISSASSAQFDLADQYAKCIMENTQLRSASNYGTLRDRFMAEHVAWLSNFEKQYYGEQLIFITGHNSHIGKTNATVGVEKSMGQIIYEEYEAGYYAIGTEFNNSKFLAPDGNSGERTVFEVKNSGSNRLAVILLDAGKDKLFLDIAAAAKDPELAPYLAEKQPMSAIGDVFTKRYTRAEKTYTQKIPVSQTYDSLIFFNSVTPSTMLPDN